MHTGSGDKFRKKCAVAKLFDASTCELTVDAIVSTSLIAQAEEKMGASNFVNSKDFGVAWRVLG